MDPRFQLPTPVPSSGGAAVRGHHRRAHSETFLRFPDTDLFLDPDGDFSFSDLDFPSLSDDSPALSDPTPPPPPPMAASSSQAPVPVHQAGPTTGAYPLTPPSSRASPCRGRRRT
ncbi:putative transcription factor PosF21 [Hordeum vulgare]|nr:putative transcription factor PosF21 [Hordeum vulgare]